MRRKRKGLSKRLRYEILRRDCFTCQYCGGKAPATRLHVDHIEPVSKGGTDDPRNLRTACIDCNLGKGALAADLVDVHDWIDDYDDMMQFITCDPQVTAIWGLPVG